MKVEQARQGVFRVTAHALELAALMAAVRWAVEGAEGDLPEPARQQLRDILDSYDRGIAQIHGNPVDRDGEAGTA